MFKTMYPDDHITPTQCRTLSGADSTNAILWCCRSQHRFARLNMTRLAELNTDQGSHAGVALEGWSHFFWMLKELMVRILFYWWESTH